MSTATDEQSGRRQRLTVYLIKDSYSEVAQFLEAKGFKQTIVAAEDGDGTLYYKSGFKNVPAWVSIFEDVSGFDASGMTNQSCRAILVMQVDKRWFCFTFGFARHLINEAAIERNFGLRVALNLGDPEAIKAIDKTSISRLALQSREQAGRSVGFEGFEFDTDIDLLKAITAKSSSKATEDQETYSGRDSVTLFTRVTVDLFADISRRLLKAYRSKKYRKNYAWIDRVEQVRDSKTIEGLDEALVSAINNDEHGKIWLAIPEIVTWEEIDGFAYRVPVGTSAKKSGPVLFPDIDLTEWLTTCGLAGKVSRTTLSQRKVFRCYREDREPDSWSIYRCLNAEIDLNGAKFILNDGEWYEVEKNYVAEVEDAYQAISNSALSLPPFGVLNEPDYLTEVATKKPDFALMDRKVIPIGGGRSTVEFCDLYSKERDLIHVKRYGGSSLLSHLLSQAYVSAECFLSEPTFRKQVNDLLPTGFKLTDPLQAPAASEYTVCVAIMSKVPGPLEIPFFSKVNLRQAVKNIQRLGFKVTKLKIERS